MEEVFFPCIDEVATFLLAFDTTWLTNVFSLQDRGKLQIA
jgi:hypothetical protein